MCSSENMTQIEDKSVSFVIISPSYNIDIQYGNKTANGKYKIVKEYCGMAKERLNKVEANDGI